MKAVDFWMVENPPKEFYALYMSTKPLELARDYLKEANPKLLSFLEGITNLDWLCAHSSRKGNVQCLQYAHELGFPLNYGCLFGSATEGRLNCLKYLYNNWCVFPKNVMEIAAKSCSIECIEYLHDKGFKWNCKICSTAACEGNLPFLKYLHENGCPWDSSTIESAKKNKHFDCVEYALQNGCPESNDKLKTSIPGVVETHTSSSRQENASKPGLRFGPGSRMTSSPVATDGALRFRDSPPGTRRTPGGREIVKMDTADFEEDLNEF